MSNDSYFFLALGAANDSNNIDTLLSQSSQDQEACAATRPSYRNLHGVATKDYCFLRAQRIKSMIARSRSRSRYIQNSTSELDIRTIRTIRTRQSELDSLDGHLQNPLVGVVPADEPTGVHKDTPRDAALVAERLVPAYAQGFTQTWADRRAPQSQQATKGAHLRPLQGAGRALRESNDPLATPTAWILHLFSRSSRNST